MKPVVDKTKCISCGLCTQTVPEVFIIGDDGFAEVIEQDSDGNPIDFSQYEAGISEAIGACPVQAISDEDEEGDQGENTEALPEEEEEVEDVEID